MRLCLVEDNAVAGLEPLTLTRPVFDLLLGSSTLGAKIARAFGIGPGPLRRGVVIRPYLEAVQRAARSAHGGQRPRLAGARAGPRGQRPLGAPGRLRAARRRTAPGWGSATASPPAPWSGPIRPSALEPGGVDAWFDDGRRAAGGPGDRRRVDRTPLGHRRPQRRARGPRLPRRGEGRSEQPPPDDRRPGRAGRPAVHPRDGADRSLHRLRHDQRADHDRRRCLGAALHPDRGSVLRSAATPSSSGPTSAAG